MNTRLKSRMGQLNPLLTATLPLIALTALLAGPPERRLLSTLASTSAFALMQWLLPEARFRRDRYFSRVNVALVLLLTNLVVVPLLWITLGNDNRIFALTASLVSMEGALLIDTVAYVAFCLGLQWALTRRSEGNRFSLLSMLAQTPSVGFVMAFAALGLLGLFLTFGSVQRLMEYFYDPSSILQPVREATVGEFLGTVLRPFLAFALITWWTRAADQSRQSGSVWRPTLIGVAAAIGITVANLTFSFNRGAFAFPLLALVAVYSARIRRVPFAFSVGALVCSLPLLMFLGEYRSDSNRASLGVEIPDRATGLQQSLLDLSENIQVYAGGPQLTGVFYEDLGWGERLYLGSTLVDSMMSPIPVLGKGFRATSGPIIYNRAIYGFTGYDDQILPFVSELFANFHIAGVVAGFAGLGMLLAKSEGWIDAVGSTFGAFIIQYIAIWAALLSVWSFSVFVQIMFYFLGPVYLYFAAVQARIWLRRSAGREFHFHHGEIIQ